MDYLKLFFCLVTIPAVISVNPCCQEHNDTIIQRQCPDGNPIKISCQHKYVISVEDHKVDEDDYLLIATSKIPTNKYCQVNFNGTASYIICFSDQNTQEETIYTIYAILELISVFFIFLTIFIYSQIRDVLDLQGVCILHSISGLAPTFLALAFSQLWPNRMENFFCVAIAYVIYFSMMYSFFWLNVLSFHIWRTVVKPHLFKIDRYWPYIYHVYGCGGPLLLLIILKIAHSMSPSENHPGFGESKCWFKSTRTQFVYFYGPMALLLFLNIIYYTWTVTYLFKQFNQVEEKKKKILKYKLLLCLKLFFIMGIPWIFELLSAACKGTAYEAIWYVTDAINTLQGILIFIILVVCRKKVVRGLADRTFCGFRLPARWRAVADEECEEVEEELNLSQIESPKT